MTDGILIGFDRKSDSIDQAVLIVGKKRPNQSVEIVNAFEGIEAIKLYEKLITRKETNHV